MIKHSIRYFNKKEVRAVWDNEQSMWWYSAVDFINILVEPNSPRRYWNNVKVRNPELSPFCGQLKLYADDGKKYVSDVINESGVRLLLTIIPSKYKKQVLDWITGMLDPIDEQSKRKAYQLYKTNLIRRQWAQQHRIIIPSSLSNRSYTPYPSTPSAPLKSLKNSSATSFPREPSW